MGQGRRLRRQAALATAAIACGILAASLWWATTGTAVASVAGVRTERFTYGDAHGRPLWLDAYLPAHATAPVPAVLLVHGGGWTGGTVGGFAGPAEDLARAGFAAFDVEYTLATRRQPGFPEQPEQVAGAARWVEDAASRLHLIPGSLAAFGSSAGGTLVGLLAENPHAPRLAAVVTWSAPTDLGAFAPAATGGCTPSGCIPRWMASDVLAYVGCSPQACPQRWRDASPAAKVRPGMPPWLLFTSADELVPLPGTEQTAALLRSRGDTVRLVVLPGHRHAGQYASAAMAPTIRFLDTYLRPVVTAAPTPMGPARR